MKIPVTTAWDIASWAVEVGEFSTPDDVLRFWESPWKYPELRTLYEEMSR